MQQNPNLKLKLEGIVNEQIDPPSGRMDTYDRLQGGKKEPEGIKTS